MRYLTCCAALLAAVALAGSLSAEDDKKAGGPGGALKLEGGYTIQSGEEDGKPIPAERLQGSSIKFTADTVVGTHKDKKEFFAAKYTLDTSKTPAVIKMTSTSPKEATTSGLVKMEKDTVTIIYALPGGAAPTDFTTKEKQQKFVLVRQTKEPKLP